ncbi:MAG: VacJ family lipoprotein [Alphaproteobacteria bacterium]|jgi:phospholipid-binding lipoprotein MlaA|nr:VacJ family lipoprotein [Alphaproteobacteria bacterium]MBT4084059.1 VacJ family lipoprotein [Alphaproteobacteria bacterium]MBT4545741.1 VacJ family lipoprotein [Alphaproteobacteria bacterium]MBT7744834.1 VacJ family lipoprotein [Alphaproteobacteria bacterium]
MLAIRRNSVPRALAISLVLVAGILAWSTTSFAALPADIARNIADTAAAANALQAQEADIGKSLGNQSLQWIKARRARDSGDNALASVIVSSISARPDLVSEIISSAVKAAPASALSLAKQTAHVYPGFAPVIARSAGLPLASIQTSAYAAYIASPDYNRGSAVQVSAPPPTVYRPVYPVIQSTQPQPVTASAPKQREIAEDQKIAPGFHGAEEISDPVEGINRAIFGFNDALDIMILRPVAALYGYLMPPPAKPAAQRFFKNLKAPVVMINDLVQLDGTDAAVTAGRFVINSTVGVLGLFEMAEDFGLKQHRADFGQSLHSYGVDAGPYIVLPLFGPSTLRDGTGKIVDSLIDPFNYILKADVRTARDVGAALVGRESLVAGLDNLRNNSIDYYAALRAAYYQNRVLGLNKGRAGLAATTAKQADDMFDSAE